MNSLRIEKSASYRELDRKDVVRIEGVVSNTEKFSDALLCVREKKNELLVWTLQKGCKSIKNCGKSQSKNVLWAGTEELATGVFYLCNGGASLGFALMMHSAGNPCVLQGKPHDFSADLTDLFVMRHKGKKNRKELTESYSIRGAQLHQTAKGLVVAAVVALVTGELYLIVGLLQQREWRKWSLEPLWSSQPCIYISVDGKEVHLTRCDIGAPVDPYAAVLAPTVPLALSAFDRVFSSGREEPMTQHGVHCLIIKDKIFSTEDETAVQDRFYQSQCFAVTEGLDALPYQCLLDVQKKKPLFSIVVPCQSCCCVVHWKATPNGAEIVASCSVFEGLCRPVALCNTRVVCTSRPEGTVVTLVLSQEWILFACEVFGTPLQIDIHGCGAHVDLRDVSQRSPGSHVHMLSLGTGQFVCSTGSACAIYSITGASLTGALPERVLLHAAEGTKEDESTPLLEKCLTQLQEVELACSADRLAEVAFRQLIPSLRYVGSAQSEVFLIERVFGRILQCSQPKSEEDWAVLWALTGIVQRILSKRSHDNSVVYTDQFFLSLVDKYKKETYKSAEGAGALKEVAGHTLSAELSSIAHTARDATKLPAEARFVMEGLGGGEPFLPFAEEVIRRMVTASTLSNGASLVRAKEGMGSYLHAVGVALLASCLDISIYLYADEPHCLRWSLDPVESNAVFVPVKEFSSQEEFEKALALSADLLCITSEDASYRPDIAFYALALGQRAHCMQAFLVLFSTLVRTALSRQEPFSENVAFLERVSKSLGSPFDMQIASALHSSKCDLVTALCYVACSGGAKLLTPLFRSYSNLFSESFCTSLLVGFLFYSTDRLISAQNNYAAATMKALLAKEESERSCAMETVRVCKERLCAVRGDLVRLWGETHALSPYKIEDIASSYLSSVRISAERSTYRGQSSGTVVSRTVVLCYRVFALVHLAGAWEAQAAAVGADGVQPRMEDLSESHPLISGALRTFQALSIAKGLPVPVEWMQSLFLRMTQRALELVKSSNEWTRFFYQLLELSGISDSSIVALKKDYFALLDAGKSQLSVFGVRDDVSFAMAQQCRAKAESIARLRTPPRAEGEDTAGIHYIFSTAGAAEVPQWPTAHDLPERRFLISASWLGELCWLERESALLRDANRVVVDHVLQCVKGQAKLRGDGEATLPSAQLLRPLYENLCRIVPPIRSHAVLETGLESRKGVTREEERHDSESHSDSVVADGDLSESFTVESGGVGEAAQVPVRRTQNDVLPMAVVSAAPGRRNDVSTHTSIASSSATPSLSVALDKEANQDACDQATGGTKPPLGFCSPESVAWWDGPSCASPPVKSSTRSPQENKDTDDLSDSGTTYTTSTSGDHSALGLGSLRESSAAPRDTRTRSPARRRRRHCRCLDRQGQCCHRHQKQLFPTARDAHHHKGCTRPPDALHGGAPNGTAPRVQLLEFARVLRPPEEPASADLRAQVPPSARPREALASATAPLQRQLLPRDEVGEIPLLTLKSGSASPARIKLYVPSDANALCAVAGDASREVDIGLKSAPFLSNATSRVSLRYLDPPPLPSSSVFSAPPPFLHLQRGPAPDGVTYAGSATGPMPPSPQHAFPHLANDGHEAGQPYPPFAAASLCGPEALPVGDCVAPNGVTAAAMDLVQSPLKESLLSATEMAGFRRYTDDLLARKAAEPLPVPVLPSFAPLGAGEAQPPASRSPEREGPLSCADRSTRPDEPHSTGFTRGLDEHNDFLQKTENLFEKRQKENEAFYRRVADSVRTLTESTLALRGEHGLNPVDQSHLVQDSIKQKNELLHLNRDLLDLQLQAAHNGDPMSFNRYAPYPTQREFLTGTQPGSASGGGVAPGTATQGALAGPRTSAASTTETGVDPLQTDAVKTDPKSASSLQSTLADLSRLNAQLQGMNTSAEAMEKAIKETREAIQRYQSHEAMEKLSAEGAALLSSLQYRTAAAEQRLSSLPRREPSVRFAASTIEIPSPSKRAFVSATFATEEAPESRTESLGAPHTFTFTTPQNVVLETMGTSAPSGASTSALATAAAPVSPSSDSSRPHPVSHPTTTTSSTGRSAPSGERSASSRQFESSDSQALQSARPRAGEEAEQEDVNNGSIFRPPVVSPPRASVRGRDARVTMAAATTAAAAAKPPPRRPLSSTPPTRWAERENQDPVFFTSPRGKSLRDVYETSKRRPAERSLAPHRAAAAHTAAPHRSTKGSATPKVRQSSNAPIPSRFSMYGPSSSSAAMVNKKRKPPPLTSFADLYDQAAATFEFPTETPSQSAATIPAGCGNCGRRK
ncbi:hypothetical protein STCU_08894 [Strigomonas culicis]|uniref:Uncharacterized protein n=1 Tax=Strigomonas culicis TaxID=28005 RepID=S9TVR9_9TRYP|nr:hypothetical protein STCU_08894 [Strigomonas culicis]|eukprot:EPY20663.1 hypothetical protein STCU_08894 [Strigomonas culicis]